MMTIIDLINPLFVSLAVLLWMPVLINHLYPQTDFRTQVFKKLALVSGVLLVVAMFLDHGVGLRRGLPATFLMVSGFGLSLALRRFLTEARKTAAALLVLQAHFYWLFAASLLLFWFLEGKPFDWSSSRLLGFVIHLLYMGFIFPVTVKLIMEKVRFKKNLYQKISHWVTLLYILASSLFALAQMMDWRPLKVFSAILLALAGSYFLALFAIFSSQITRWLLTQLMTRFAAITGFIGFAISGLYALKIGGLLTVQKMAISHGVLNGLAMTGALVLVMVASRAR